MTKLGEHIGPRQSSHRKRQSEIASACGTHGYKRRAELSKMPSASDITNRSSNRRGNWLSEQSLQGGRGHSG
ncbi:unnamed protein product [Blepharisma stoltei]|uniref:Uncharacterized protein n=1 Tax=Blepharisma stoltei TaxID=1481888 RepID=A0AAU9J0F9_9CILI|nr:unnamed protein product [Blepharisma stoltei]